MDYAANVLIVSAGEKSRNTLSDLLKMDGFLTLTTVKSGSQARRLLLSCGYDLVIVNTPLPDEFGDEIVAAFAEEGSGACLLYTSSLFSVNSIFKMWAIYLQFFHFGGFCLANYSNFEKIRCETCKKRLTKETSSYIMFDEQGRSSKVRLGMSVPFDGRLYLS